MSGQVVILDSPYARRLAHQLVDKAPDGATVQIRAAKRSLEQNAKMWAMLSDISRHKPDGREHTTEVWKALFMHALGYEQRFLMGLNGEPFPEGFRSSQMSKAQMADLITFIQEYGDRHGVQWTDNAGETQ